jgi:endoglucanase
MKKIFITMMLAALAAFAVKPNRVGPVSTYGELKANGGKLSGSCSAYKDKAVQVRGMSLFWSSGADSSLVYYTAQAMGLMVQDMGIEVLRFALGAGDEKFDSHKRSYTTGGANDQKAMVSKLVRAAVENDIYIILDWHTEGTSSYTNDAKEFFSWAAQEFGQTDNVIFEIWNEPANGASMSDVKRHADQVIPAIRAHSDNLILVGSPDWSSHPEECAKAGISDNNYGCTLHFYAATGAHQVGSGYDGRASEAMSKGVPVFATEWGTVSSDGNGSPNRSASEAWVNWMNQNGVSWANWSASAIAEQSAAFSTLTLNQGLKYTESGNMVKGWMNKSASYSDCGLGNHLGSDADDNGFSTGVADGATTDLIDDMEDGDRYTYTGGFWSAWADSDDDKDGRGSTRISNPKFTNDFGKETYDVLIPAKDGDDSKFMAGMEGIYIDQGAYKWAPYVAMGLNLTKDTANFAEFAKCTSISYKYKGAAHNFRIELSTITNYNFHFVDAEASGEWKTVELTPDLFQQHTTWSEPQITDLKSNLGKANRLAWEVNGVVDRPASEIQPLYDYLYVDDIRCNGASITAISTLETPESSSSGPTSSPNGSSSSVGPGPAGSSSSGVGPATQVITVVDIDDVEDGDEVLKTTGTWYAYNDSVPGGLSTITNTYDPALPGYVVVFPGTEDPTNGTAGFVGLKGIVLNPGTYKEKPFVAIGLNTNADTTKGIDLSQCSALSYRYKGAAHSFKLQDGSVKDYDYHYVKNQASDEWKTSTYNLDNFTQDGWGEAKELNYAAITKMAWEVLGWANSDQQPSKDFLYIDDLKCVNIIKDAIKSVRIVSNSIRLGVQGNSLSVNLDKAGSVRVQIFDLMGHAVSNTTESMNAGANTVSLEKMSKGSYIVRIVRGSEVKAARVTIR